MGSAVSGAVGVSELFFPAVPPSYDTKNERLVWFRTDAGSSVPAMLVLPRFITASNKPRNLSGPRKLSEEVSTICIYFHPNACDIGQSINEMEVIRDGAFGGDAAVLAPEYPGYGLLGEFNASPQGIDRIAKAAFAFATTFHGFKAAQVVLWGRSIGSGPASALARSLAAGGDEQVDKRRSSVNSATSTAGRDACSFGIMQSKRSPFQDPTLAVATDVWGARGEPCGALVLMAPFMSIAEVAKTHAGSFAASFVEDMWDVADCVADEALTEMPMCVIHPEEDEIVPKKHGEELYTRSASKQKLGVWITGEGHNLRSTVYHMKPVREFLVAHLASLAAQQPEERGGEAGEASAAARAL